MQKMLFVIALVVALVALIKLILTLKIQRRLGRVAPDIGEFLGRAPDPGERLLVYLHSQHCTACKPMTPLINAMRTKYNNVLSINIAAQPQLARDFGIIVTPTVVIIENNNILAMHTGTLNQKQLDTMLQPVTADA